MVSFELTKKKGFKLKNYVKYLLNYVVYVKRNLGHI